MADFIKYRDKIGCIVTDDEPDSEIVRFIDNDHILYKILRKDLRLEFENGTWYYKTLIEPVTSYHYNDNVSDACCALSRYLNNN